MSDNPYQAPSSEAVGVKSGDREDLKKVATYQRGILMSILGQIITSVLSRASADEMMIIISGIASLIFLLVGFVMIILLTNKVYQQVWKVVLCCIFSLIPCINLIVLLIVNQKATNILMKNGIKVGLLGANPKDIN